MNWAAILTRFNPRMVKISQTLTLIGGVILVALSLMTTSEVIARYIFNRPIQGVTELGSIFLGYLVFLPQAFTLLSGGHVRIDMLTREMPERTQAIFDIFAYLLALFLMVLATIDGWRLFWDSFIILERMGTAGVNIPWYVGKFAVPLGLFFFCLMLVNKLLLSIAKLLPKTEDKTGKAGGGKEAIDEITVRGKM